MSAHPQQEQERVRIGELSRRTGVQADTIRAWERRYGLVEPRRTSKGYRLYSSADEAVVRAMRELTAKGVAAAEAAALARRGAEAPPAPSVGALDPAAQAHRLRRALEAFDEEEANAILDDCLGGLSLPRSSTTSSQRRWLRSGAAGGTARRPSLRSTSPPASSAAACSAWLADGAPAPARSRCWHACPESSTTSA